MNASANAITGNRLAVVTRWRGDSNDRDTGDITDTRFTDHTGAADIVTSQTKADTELHSVVLDIDLEAELVPSTTPGHFHLYIDKALPWWRYAKLLDALAEAGILEPGYVSASKARGFTAVRLPWIKKETDVAS